MLAPLRKKAYEARHYLRDRVFRNNQPTLVNLSYAAYQRKCRKIWSPRPNIDEAKRASAARFEREGFLVVPPTTRVDCEKLKAKVDDLFDAEENRFFVMDGLYRLIDGIELIPELINFIDPEMEAILEAYYRSHFKLFGIYVYRTVPSATKPQSSFLWHIDNCPRAEVKLMVYLDHVVEDTGAIKLKSKTTTNAIRDMGFRNREQIKGFQTELEKRSTSTVVEGRPGTRILFENGGVIHKATAPMTEHRDVVTFVIIPSDISWRAHFARNRNHLSTNAGVCINPWLDTPQFVGYEY